ncbi:MAG: ATP phosphoribosyltransferase, partial [Acidobacteriia bacterium]|nr:ATP phosphoribosyltransferase [Terriglobia bacterium]
MNPIRFAIPKGSLEKKTRAFFERSGIDPRGYADGSRGYRPDLGLAGVDVKMMRPQEIPYMLQAGFFDLGISGIDWYYESEAAANVEDLLDLGIGRVDIVLCVSDQWD